MNFNISAWSFWDKAGERPEVPQVPMMLRRRASLADRMALKTAFEVWPSGESIASVFCSRHGEVARSVELLELMAKGEGQLPMSFSLSVHNAASGLFGIARGDTKASTSVAAGPETLEMGISEACALLKGGEARVLLVNYDDALPAPLAPYKDDEDRPFALAMLLEAGDAFSLEITKGAAGAARSQHALALAPFLKSAEKSLQTGRWAWRRNH
jgi:hypothetical protein